MTYVSSLIKSKEIFLFCDLLEEQLMLIYLSNSKSKSSDSKCRSAKSNRNRSHTVMVMVNLKIRSIWLRFRDFYSRRYSEWQFMSILQSQLFFHICYCDLEEMTLGTAIILQHTFQMKISNEAVSIGVL